MTESNGKVIKIPVAGEEKQHTEHKIRSIMINADEGIKALYCIQDKKLITYLFSKSKAWTLEKAKEWAECHESILVKFDEVIVDQEEEFLSVVATYVDGESKTYQPNSESFIMSKDIENKTMGVEEDNGSSETMELLKIDKMKQIVYGIYLVPDKADHHGDVISAEDIEKVAHDFLVEYRTVDEMHKNVISAEIVESAIAWEDGLSYYGKKLTKGTWFGAIKINGKDVWQKVLDGEYKAFSVRIAGVREPIEKKEEGDDKA